MKYLFIIFIISVALFSCEKEIKFNHKNVEPKIVVNALLNTDSIWSIHISKSLSILDKADPGILPNATVSVKDANGNIIEVLTHQSDGNFISISGNKPASGGTYKLEVSHNNFKSVEATTLIPTPVSFDVMDTAKFNFKSEENMRIRIRFLDPVNEQNFYFIKAMVGYKSYLFDEFGNIVDSVINTYSEPLGSNDLNIENLDEMDSKGNELYLKDNLFNGKTVELDLYLNYYLFQSQEYSSINLFFASASKDYYLHKISKNKYDATQGNPFAEPVIIYSNVKDGIGIFAGYSYSLKPIR